MHIEEYLKKLVVRVEGTRFDLGKEMRLFIMKHVILLNPVVS